MQMDIGNMCNIQLVNIAKKNLTVATKAEGVVPLPGSRLGGVVVAVTFPKTAVLFSDASETASLPAFMHRFGDPVDPWVATNLYKSPIIIGGDQRDFKNLRPCDWGQRG